MTTVIGILILVCALFLIVSVLLQSSKNHRMSGVVSGGAHLIGPKMRKMINAFVAGDMQTASEIHHELDPLFKSFTPNGRVNPMPVLRAAMEMAGMPVGPARMPLDQASEEEKAGVRKQLERLGVI